MWIQKIIGCKIYLCINDMYISIYKLIIFKYKVYGASCLVCRCQSRIDSSRVFIVDQT